MSLSIKSKFDVPLKSKGNGNMSSEIVKTEHRVGFNLTLYHGMVMTSDWLPNWNDINDIKCGNNESEFSSRRHGLFITRPGNLILFFFTVPATNFLCRLRNILIKVFYLVSLQCLILLGWRGEVIKEERLLKGRGYWRGEAIQG